MVLVRVLAAVLVTVVAAVGWSTKEMLRLCHTIQFTIVVVVVVACVFHLFKALHRTTTVEAGVCCCAGSGVEWVRREATTLAVITAILAAAAAVDFPQCYVSDTPTRRRCSRLWCGNDTSRVKSVNTAAPDLSNRPCEFVHNEEGTGKLIRLFAKQRC
jgi:hypothetical protein